MALNLYFKLTGSKGNFFNNKKTFVGYSVKSIVKHN